MVTDFESGACQPKLSEGCRNAKESRHRAAVFHRFRVGADFRVVGLARRAANRRDESYTLALLLPQGAWFFPSASGLTRSSRQLALWRSAFLLL